MATYSVEVKGRKDPLIIEAEKHVVGNNIVHFLKDKDYKYEHAIASIPLDKVIAIRKIGEPRE